MKLVHLSDLHLGKRVNEVSMLDDQRYILGEVRRVIDAERPDAVLIAGDVYDRPVPPAEAVELFDDFLYSLVKRDLPVFVISGNHDSPERLSFCARMIDASGIHFARAFSGKVEPFTLTDAYGPVDIFLLPFLKPAAVRRFYPDQQIDTYTDALRAAVGSMDIDPARRSVLVAHQFVTGGARSESEELSVGGLDNVDGSVFAPFDYVALGHLHGPQNVGSERVRYCGSPLKYSFSEADQVKSVTVAELGKKGGLSLRTVPLVPLRDLRELRGAYEQLADRRNYEGTETGDYLHITLTDEEDVYDALGKLRAIYPNLMKLDYDNLRTRSGGVTDDAAQEEDKSPLELFAALFEQQNGRPMSGDQAALCRSLIEEIWEVEA